jgi:methylated-DNA-[protein]-cysteine S-methyltransferase
MHTALFPTPIGACGIAWTTRGIAGLLLPEARESETRRVMARRWPRATEAIPPPSVAAAIAAITRLLRGEASDLSAIEVDLSGVPDFHRRVYAIAGQIPPGETRTYGALATALGAPGAARAVGQAMARNPVPLIVPCHRVLAANGRMHGFSAPGGVVTKRRLLEIEGAKLVDVPRLFA